MRTAAQIADAVREGSTTAREVAQACLAQATAREDLHAFLSVDADHILAQADAVDAKRAAGQELGLLAGVPVAIKDNINVRGLPTTCASKMLENFVAPYDAHVIERLVAADAVCFGKTNLDEFAMGSSTENSAFGPSKNPHDVTRTPGGSSGGSAAAVAGNITPLALGSDTGGSIRQPAAFTGTVGMKPTYGRVSRYGLVAFASSLDQIGPFARTVDDAARLLSVISGHDKRDTTSVEDTSLAYDGSAGASPSPNPGGSAGASPSREGIDGLRIGVLTGYDQSGIDAGCVGPVTKATALLREAGNSITDVTLPNADQGVAVYYIVAPSEASGNLARYDGVHYGRRAENVEDLNDLYERSRGEGFGDEVKRRIMLGTYALSSGYYDAYYKTALRVRRLIHGDFMRAFEQCDVILTPVTPHPAFVIGEIEDPLKMYLNDLFTIGANLAGLPAMSLPVGLASDYGDELTLPVGLQLIAAPWQEEKVLRAARWLEERFRKT